MTQNDIDHAVSRATGEDLTEIRRRGFSLMDPMLDGDPEPDDLLPQMVDWDQLKLDRNVPLVEQPFRRAA